MFAPDQINDTPKSRAPTIAAPAGSILTIHTLPKLLAYNPLFFRDSESEPARYLVLYIIVLSGA